MTELLHVTEAADWERAAGLSCKPGGFIHLCTDAQLDFVLSRHFAGRTGLLLLRLDPAGLDIRWEPSEPGMSAFPHLYGDLPRGAVLAAEPL